MARRRTQDLPRPTRFRDAYVLLASFVVGGAILVLEILGTRVISPYYGASIYVWSSLIGVTLASLTLGYGLGGWAADRWPGLACFAAEIVGGAFGVLLVPWTRRLALVATAPLGLRAGSLLSAAVLFAPPLVLLSMTGPVAIRVVTSEFTFVGRGVGKIYGVSTLGSMLGAVATGFYLIPSFSVRALLVGTGAVLLLLGVVGLFLAQRAPGALGAGTVGLIAVVLLAGAPPAPASNLIYMTNSFYGELKVLDMQDRRVLMINGIDNGLVDRRTMESVAPYIATFGYLPAARPAARRALCIGLGAGSVPRSFRLRYGIDSDTVEIDPAIVAIARRYFGFPSDSQVFIDDGRRFVEGTSNRYDLVVLDAFTSETHPFHLFTREFFAAVDRILTPDGIFAINLAAVPSGPQSRGWRSVYRTLGERFAFVRVFSGPGAGPGAAARFTNLLMVAAHGALPSPATVEGRDARDGEVLSAMAGRELAASAEPTPLLTDDYNPMDDLQRDLFVAWREDLIAKSESVLLFDGLR